MMCDYYSDRREAASKAFGQLVEPSSPEQQIAAVNTLCLLKKKEIKNESDRGERSSIEEEFITNMLQFGLSDRNIRLMLLKSLIDFSDAVSIGLEDSESDAFLAQEVFNEGDSDINPCFDVVEEDESLKDNGLILNDVLINAIRDFVQDSGLDGFYDSLSIIRVLAERKVVNIDFVELFLDLEDQIIRSDLDVSELKSELSYLKYNLIAERYLPNEDCMKILLGSHICEHIDCIGIKKRVMDFVKEASFLDSNGMLSAYEVTILLDLIKLSLRSQHFAHNASGAMLLGCLDLLNLGRLEAYPITYILNSMLKIVSECNSYTSFSGEIIKRSYFNIAVLAKMLGLRLAELNKKGSQKFLDIEEKLYLKSKAVPLALERENSIYSLLRAFDQISNHVEEKVNSSSDIDRSHYLKEAMFFAECIFENISGIENLVAKKDVSKFLTNVISLLRSDIAEEEKSHFLDRIIVSKTLSSNNNCKILVTMALNYGLGFVARSLFPLDSDFDGKNLDSMLNIADNRLKKNPLDRKMVLFFKALRGYKFYLSPVRLNRTFLTQPPISKYQELPLAV